MVRQASDQRWRLSLLCVVFSAFGLLLLYRTYSYQVLDYQRFKKLANGEHRSEEKINPKRGDILDRNGYPLVATTQFDSVYARPADIKDQGAVANSLSKFTGDTPESILTKLQNTTKTDVVLKRRLPADVGAKIDGLNLQGVYLQRDSVRAYPEGSLAPQLLGFVGMDFSGLAGLELSLDKQLTGEAGSIAAEKDPHGGQIGIGQKQVVPAKDGSDAVLTIDRYIQRMAERELAQALTLYKAKGGVIIIMEPKTGHVLAMASAPSYDLTAEDVYDPSKQDLYKPVAVTDIYEPGSVMKIVTMSSAIEEKLVTPETSFNDTGVFTVDGVKIRNWDKGAHAKETMTQILINSCNVGAAWVATQLGADKFYSYLDAFGFGKPTGIDLQGEALGVFRTPKQKDWTRVDLATNAYGQGIAVTPIQMMTAINTVANGGVLMKPMIVRGFRQGDSFKENPPVQVRRVISKETADTVTDMMVHVVEDNSLKASVVSGYKIAGKTGTADLPTATGYTSGVTYASQVGFAPVGDPKFSMLVRIDGPEKQYGGLVASPVFKRIAEQLFAYMKIPPTEPVVSAKPTPGR